MFPASPQSLFSLYISSAGAYVPVFYTCGRALKSFCLHQLIERLSSLAEESHNIQMKKLKDVCDK